MEATIVVIEESLDLSRLFEYMLRADGYIVHSFHDWRSAHAALLNDEPKLIIFDWALTNAAGYRWVEALRREPATSHIPILFVCGEPPPRAILELLGNSGISMIEKPFDVFMFRNRVTALLGVCERVAGLSY